MSFSFFRESAKLSLYFREKLRIIEHTKNRGIVPTRNEGVKLVRGEFLCFLDADNVLPPDYIKRLLAKMTREKLDVVYTDLQCFGNKNNLILLPEFSVEGIIARNIVDMGALVRTVVAREQKFDINLNNLSHEDWDFFLGLALKGRKFSKVNGVALLYGQHEVSRSSHEKDAEKIALRIVKINDYIVNKYKKKYPKKVDFLPGNELVRWHLIGKYNESLADSLKNENDKMKQEIADQSKLIHGLKDALSATRNSASYKIGQKVVVPFAKIKMLFKR